jgi:transposase-like protein
MSKGKPRDSGKEQHWRRVLDDWQRSGLSVRAFCRRHRLAEPTFYAWRRTLQQGDGLGHASQAPDPVTFLPVHIEHDAIDPRPPVELVVAGGRCLRIPPGFDPATLRALLAVLEGPSC